MTNSLHLQFSYGTLLKGKRDLLMIEESLIKIKRTIERYKKIRKIESLEKKTAKKIIKELRTELNNLEESIPHAQFKGEREKSEKVTVENLTLEQELEEIRRKLAMLK